MFELLCVVGFIFLLGAILVAKDWKSGLQRRWRGRRMKALIRKFPGREVERAKAVLGAPSEVVTGKGGRRLYVWKNPERGNIPSSPDLLIVTLTVDGAGIVSQATWEVR